MTPLTEAKLWKRLRPWLNAQGLATRLETSTVSGIPDVLWVTAKGSILLELKIRHGNRIKLQAFQVAFHEKCFNDGAENSYIVVGRMRYPRVELYTWRSLRHLPRNVVSGGVTLDIEAVPPLVRWSSAKDVFDIFLKS